MAIKKVDNKNVENKVEVEVTPVLSDVAVPTDVAVTPDVAVAEAPVVEVEAPVEEAKPEVEIDTDKAEVNTNNKPLGNAKIRMRVDHKCCIAMERYDLKAGKTYVVPENVKNILNKAGYLAPL